MTTHDLYLDRLLSLPGLHGPIVSPDGSQVAWTWSRIGPTADVYVAAADGISGPIRLTDTDENTWAVAWAPDSRRLIVRQDTGGDERAQLFLVEIDAPLRLRPLTEPAPNHFLRGGALTPDRRFLIYGANVDPSTGDEIESTCVIRHELATGGRRILARPRTGGWNVPSLNRPGTHILYTRNDRHPAGEQLWMVDIDGRSDEEILNAGDSAKVYGSWFPDGDRVLVLAEAGRHRRVGVWDRARRSLHWPIDDPARNIEACLAPYGTDRVVLVEVTDAVSRCSLLDPETSGEVVLPPIPGELHLLAPTADGRWIARYAGSTQPPDLVLLDPADLRPDTFVSLTHVWEQTPLGPADFVAAESVHWPSADGQVVQGWLYRTRRPPRGTIVSIHGGPTWHARDEIDPEIQFLANSGFHVFVPNYRGSTGFGLEYQEAIKADGWGGMEQIDIRTGIEYLIERGIAVPGRIGVTGTSYGGYSAWHAITHFSVDLVAAAAPICGMTDLVVDYESTRPDLRPYSEEMMGGSPTECPDRYRERSPIHFVDRIGGRLLIVQGLRDPNVTRENVRAVESALRAVGVPYELLTFDDEGHGIARPKNLKSLYPQLAEFFASAFASA